VGHTLPLLLLMLSIISPTVMHDVKRVAILVFLTCAATQSKQEAQTTPADSVQLLEMILVAGLLASVVLHVIMNVISSWFSPRETFITTSCYQRRRQTLPFGLAV
jgi:uncharacterized metal-binding protein